MRTFGVVVMVTMIGCGDGGGSVKQDGGAQDSPAAIVDAPVDAVPFNCATSPASGTHKLFLAFEGVTLTAGTPSDATTDTVSFLDPSKTTATIPAWKTSAADRDAQIASIVCLVRESLFAYDIEVVTTRPATGDYEMIVFGGQPLDLGYNLSSSSGIGGITATDCQNTNAKDVTWIAEHPQNNNTGGPTAEQTANLAPAFVGVDNALIPVADAHNCMCAVANGSNVACDTSKACVFTDNAAIVHPNDCSVQAATQNQITKLTMHYGARL